MIVDELAAKLGLEVDEGLFLAGEKLIELLHHGLEAVGVAAAAATAALAGTVKMTVDAGREAARTSQMVGLSAEVYQELRGAAEDAGASGEALTHGLQHLARSVYEATQGNQEARASFHRLGVSFGVVGGAARPLEDVLGDVVEKFAALEDGPKKTALAMHVFSRSGTELIPLLNKGREGLARMREEARELGVVLSDEVIASAEKFRQAVGNVEGAARGVAYAVGGPLLDAIRPYLDALKEWLVHNRALIAQRVHQAVHLAAVAGRALWVVVGPLARGLAAVVTNTTAWQFAAATLAGVLALRLVPMAAAAVQAIGALVFWLRAVSIWSAISAAAAAAAPYLVAAAWAALAVVVGLVLEDLYQFVTGGESLLGELVAKIGSVLPAAWEATKDALATAVSFWRRMFDEFFAWLAAKVRGAVGLDLLKGVAGGLVGPGVAGALGLFGSGGGASPAAAAAASPARRAISAVLHVGEVHLAVDPGDPRGSAGTFIGALSNPFEALVAAAAAAVEQP